MLAVLETAHAISPQAKVILFGSRARGDFRPDSDWDFLVLTKEPESDDLSQKLTDAVLENVELRFGAGISLTIHSFEEWENRRETPFYQQIKEDGIEIMDYSKEDLIKYRFNRAEESLQAARVLAETNLWNAVANRLYYACYYAAIGVFLELGFSPKPHAGVKTLFNREFAVSTTISMEQLKLYNQLFMYRQRGDYEDMIDLSQDMIVPLIPKATNLVKTLKTMVENG